MDILLVQLKDGRAHVRAEAAKTFSEYPTPLARDDLVRLLDDGEEQVRYWAVRALESLDDPRLADPIAPRLFDGAAAVRMMAARAMRRWTPRHHLPEILESLGDPDEDVVFWAVEAAAAYGEYAIPQLVGALGALDWTIREAAAEALYRIGREAVPPLVRALERDEADVRYWAIRVLGRLRAGEATERIREFLDGGSPDLASAAMQALAQLGDRVSLPRIVSFLGTSSPTLRTQAVEALASFGDFAVKLLADLLEENRRVVRLSASQALSLSGDSALVPILEKLREESTELRFWSVKALERFSSPVVVPLLVDLLADDSEEVQLAAAEALASFELPVDQAPRILGSLGTENWRVRQALARAVGGQDGWGAALLAPWLQDEDADVRFWCTRILGWLGDADAIPLLLDCFEDEEWPIRKVAAEGLAGFGERAVPAIKEALATRAADANQRYWLTRSLVGIQDLSLVPGLVSMLEDADGGVRTNAHEALVTMGDAAVPDLLDKLRQVEARVLREGIAKVLVEMRTSRLTDLMQLLVFRDPELDHWVTWILGHLGEGAVPYLADQVRQGSERERYQSLRALYWIEHPRTVQIALDHLYDEFPSIRRMAVRILGRYRAASAREHLVALLGDEADVDLRLAAAEALGRIGGEGALEALLAHLKPSRWEVARVVIEALRELGDPGAAPALRELLVPRNRDLWPFLCAALAAVGSEEDVPALRKQLAAAEPRDLVSLLRALGALAGPGEAGAFEPYLSHESWEVREAAVGAYGDLGQGADPEPLKSLAKGGDPLLRSRARQALRRVLGEEAWSKFLRGRMKKLLDDPAEVAYQKATEAIRAKNPVEARKQLRKAIRISKRAEYFGLLGSLCMDSGDKAEAERHLRKACDLAPGDPVPLVKLGVLQAMIGKEAKAVASLRRVLGLPGVPEPVRELAHRTLARLTG